MNGVTYDLILVGGGLANGLIAWRLKVQRPELRILLVEKAPVLGGNHTWSFHDQDLTPAQLSWLRPLIVHRWPRYQVIFPQRRRTLNSGYNSLTSDRFAQVLGAALAGSLQMGTGVTSMTPGEVALDNGEVLRATTVIDGRGPQPTPHMVLGQQAFLGQLLRLEQPHGLDAPILMDATVAQSGGYRFVYVLPFSADTVLIEDTHYVDRQRLSAEQLREHIRAYAQARDWRIAEILREESGVLPITLAGDFDAFWATAAQQPRVGLRAGLYHCTTGYSLPHAVHLAETLAKQADLSASAVYATIHRQARLDWRRQGFFRLLNRMLFLAGSAEDRWRVMQRFYGLSEGLIQRFYAGHPSPLDKLRILTGKPPVPVLQAWRAAVRTHPTDFENLLS